MIPSTTPPASRFTRLAVLAAALTFPAAGCSKTSPSATSAGVPARSAAVAAPAGSASAAVAAGPSAAMHVDPPRTDAARVEVPISQVKLPDGTIRYWVPVRVGRGKPIHAMLDTGSSGLRVLAAALSPGDYEETPQTQQYHYASGVTLEGPLARAAVRVGTLRAGKILVQVVKSVHCGARKAHCAAAHLAPGQYRIGGDGLAGQGFEAILGVSVRSPLTGAAVNPLAGIGEQAWVVELPLPTAPADAHGTLLVNPTAADRAGFQMLPVPPKDHAALELPLCLDHAAVGGSCPPAKLDSGARAGLPAFYAYDLLFDRKQEQIGAKSRSAR